MTRVLTLSGSTRRDSINRKLQVHMGERLRDAGLEVTEISLADYPMALFDQDLEPDSVPEAAARLAELFRSHDGIFIATPEYNGGLPPLTVNTIAWLSRQKPSPFRHAIFGIGGVSTGKYGAIWALSHLRDSLSKLGAVVSPMLLGIGPASEAFAQDGGFTETSVNTKIDQMIRDFTELSRRPL
ncbi:NADPH-dependent FMN reductase [Pelagibacterium montanilacus]|uniref:NADPH-dependent FMN reductase n=1 Tax=Pelagibacterium montanilacus TaxID=2185280 RepID=UPI000F8E99B9|nr:NADPH-dependent FMN reductase [Pelagibacterium montanilacus]